MNIGIVGSGNIGAVLARHFTKLGHSVLIANSRGPGSLTELAQETKAKPVSVPDAAKGMELLVITIPMKSIPELPKDLLQCFPRTAIVVDTCNYYPVRDGVIEAIENGLTASEWVAQQLSHPVVKVFNNIIAQRLADGGRPKGQHGRITLPVAGNDPAAKERIIALLDTLGFDGLDAGTLQDSWRQQLGTPAYCTDLDRTALPKTLATADRSVAPEMGQKAFQKMMRLPPGTPGEEVVRQARAKLKVHPRILNLVECGLSRAARRKTGRTLIGVQTHGQR